VVRRRLIEHIDASLEHTITLQELATLAGLSEFHLQRMFTVSCGVSPHGFILNRRIDRARRMLADAEPIAQIASACGFSSQSHLTRMFKTVTGTTPSAYRRCIASN
jgi:AraC family transcriptional regulator